MTPNELIPQLPMVPYAEHGSDFIGMDCFGLIELWHREILGIEINDRQGHLAGSQGFSDGYDEKTDWITLERPENHAMAVMRAIWGGVDLKYGHCGMIWDGRVYHFKPDHGFQHSPFDNRQLRITEILKHKSCNQ